MGGLGYPEPLPPGGGVGEREASLDNLAARRLREVSFCFVGLRNHKPENLNHV